jgi:signal transduction histidine kinase
VASRPLAALPGISRGGLMQRTLVASVILAVLFGGVFATVLQENLEQSTARNRARHARGELARSQTLLGQIIDVETGQRGFIITGDKSFLGPWRAARTQLVSGARWLGAYVDDDVTQERRARQMSADSLSYIKDYSVPVVLSVERGMSSAREIEATREGKRRVDRLRAEFAAFGAAEGAKVTKLENRVDSAARRSVVVAAAGLGSSIVLIALFVAYFARAIVLPVRRAAAMAGRLAGGDLAVRMAETGTGEIGDLERSFNTMGRSLERSRAELHQLAAEQSALRRVATLVARGVPPSEVWVAVVTEVCELLGPDLGALLRYESDNKATAVALRGRLAAAEAADMPIDLEGESAAAMVLRTGFPARLDTAAYDPASLGTAQREFGIRSEVGAPVVVDDRLWGVMVAGWTEQEAPPGAEARIAEFTALVATAIANADSQAALSASRARVVATADETRRRIERDLHDGAQQRLVHAILSLKLARQELGGNGGHQSELVDEALQHAELANTQLRELVHGILPAALSRGGLQSGIGSLVARAPLPVTADITPERLSPALEATAYFIIAEALTNVTKHAHASRAAISAHVEDDALRLEVRDDGAGGADLGAGSGLLGLQDRAAALDGELCVQSPAGGGTVITVTLPITRGR